MGCLHTPFSKPTLVVELWMRLAASTQVYQHQQTVSYVNTRLQCVCLGVQVWHGEAGP